jgi:hypothetical protein
MMIPRRWLLFLLSCLLLIGSIAGSAYAQAPADCPHHQENGQPRPCQTGILAGQTDKVAAEKFIRERINAYAEYTLTPDLSMLSKNEKMLLFHLVEAAEAIDSVFWMQMGDEALAARDTLAKAAHTCPVQKLFADFVMINYGPFDTLKEGKRFYGQGKDRLPGVGLYPADLTKEEFENFVKAVPEVKDDFYKINTVIRRVGSRLVAIPYETVYRTYLEKASVALLAASKYADNASLKKYLELRSQALLSGDFYESDLAWMDLKDNQLDTVIGPIETYIDGLLGLKAAYEASVMIKDPVETAHLDYYKSHLLNLEQKLPYDEEKYKRTDVGAQNILEVVNVLYFAGDFNEGVKTIAASLPNDERVISQKGAKKQLYKNLLEAKFHNILTPIAKILMDEDQLAYVQQEAFVTDVLLHEISHTLGPVYVFGPEKKALREALGNRYSAIEEAKADIVGVYSVKYFQDSGFFTPDQAKAIYATYIAGLFRSVRFGVEAHGIGVALEIHRHLEYGGMEYNPKTGKFRVNFDKIHASIEKVANELLMIEAKGDLQKANEVCEKVQVLPQTVQDGLKKLAELPIDIKLKYKLSIDL